MPQRAFITGGAGFVGSNLAEALVARGDEVTVYDDLSLGRREHVAHLEAGGRLRFIEADLLDLDRLCAEIEDHDVVWHLAANSDIAKGAAQTDRDLRLGTLATYNVLEAMRRVGLRDLVFASTSAIYGEATVMPTPEGYGPLLPISLYGASKLACEGLITAFCHNYDLRAFMCRFGNVVGDNGTHGALFDFLCRLQADPSRLTILGDGRQAKPYLYVKDLVGGMIFIYENAPAQVNVFNLACDGATPVTRIAEAAIRALLGGGEVALSFTGGQRGWKGDVPQVRLDPGALAALGWTAAYGSDEAVDVAARALAQQLKARGGL